MDLIGQKLDLIIDILSKPTIVDWLMFVITFVYVVATILICVYNNKSNKTMRDQLEEDRKQQRQNTAIQLYEKRREILAKIEKDDFGVRTDIELLFNERILELYDKYEKQFRKYELHSDELGFFEGRIKEDNPEKFDEYEKLVQESEQSGDHRFLDRFASQFDFYIGNNNDWIGERRVFRYLEITSDLSQSCVNKDKSKVELVDSIKDYISCSIK